MATNASAISTAEQLWAANLDQPCELIRGELITMSPAGGYHCGVAGRISGSLSAHTFPRDMGVVFVSEPGFIVQRNPDTVRVPDVAFVMQERLDEYGDYAGFLDLAPDLAVEIISPYDSRPEVEAKAKLWLAAGCPLVLVADPKTRSIKVYQGDDVVCYADPDAVIDGNLAVPGWKLRVRDAFPK
jgi:Uma2 family endonuclease